MSDRPDYIELTDTRTNELVRIPWGTPEYQIGVTNYALTWGPGDTVCIGLARNQPKFTITFVDPT